MAAGGLAALGQDVLGGVVSPQRSLCGTRRERLYGAAPLEALRTQLFCPGSQGGAALERGDASLRSGAKRHVSRHISPRYHGRRPPQAAAPGGARPSPWGWQCPRQSVPPQPGCGMRQNGQEALYGVFPDMTISHGTAGAPQPALTHGRSPGPRGSEPRMNLGRWVLQESEVLLESEVLPRG